MIVSSLRFVKKAGLDKSSVGFVKLRVSAQHIPRNGTETIQRNPK